MVHSKGAVFRERALIRSNTVSNSSLHLLLSSRTMSLESVKSWLSNSAIFFSEVTQRDYLSIDFCVE